MKWLDRSLWAVVAGLSVASASVAAEKKATEIEVLKDVAYVSGNNAADRQKLDLYLPKGKKDFPVLLFFHGGGWAKGDRKEVATLGETFARHGVGVAAVGYRLHPDAKNPEQLQDAAKAFAWVKTNVAKHGGKADQLFVGGHSSGAQIAALLASDERYLKAEGAGLGDVRGVIFLSGPVSIPEARKEVFGDEDARKEASPITYASRARSPFFLAYADKDSAGRDKQIREFADALKANNLVVEVVEAKDRDHGSLFAKIAKGDPTGEAILGFINKNASTVTGQSGKK
jgi:acetyl esterase/lipase